MVRSIDNKTISRPRTTAPSNTSNSTAVHSSTKPVDTDSIDLTDTAFLLSQAEQSLSSTPIVNAKHVSTIINALNNSQYQVDAELVAEKIIESEQQFLDS